jgi:hypothetical protein
MSTEFIANPAGTIAIEAARLLRDLQCLIQMKIAKDIAAGGPAYVPPKQYPCLVPCIINDEYLSQQMKIVSDSVAPITDCVNALNTELGDFHGKVTGLAAKAKEQKYVWSEDCECWSCEEIAACKQALERKVCTLSAQVAAMTVAVQGVVTGFCLCAICPPDPCGEGGAFVGRAGVKAASTAPSSDAKAPAAQKK